MFTPGSFDRRIALGILLASLVPAFALVHFLVAEYRSQRHELAVEWSLRGAQDLASNPSSAVTDFEAALSYGPERTSDRFQLAKALVAAGRPAEAEAQLLTLSAEDPANGEVSVELARIAAAREDLADAVRYYHAAADGRWTSNPAAARRDTRIELARLLMSHGQEARGQAELIGALQLDARETLEIAERVLALDPYGERLSARARAQRTVSALAIARSRLERCEVQRPDLGARLAAMDELRPRVFERDPSLIDTAMAIAFDIEKLPSGSCGADTADDRALEAIAGQHARER